MKTSSRPEVAELYDGTAESYSEMMDAEIDLPFYAETLCALARRMERLAGPVLDTSCGSGHMLKLIHDRVDPDRTLFGIDLSERMVEIARARLSGVAQIDQGDMTHLAAFEASSMAGVLSFFALHHLDEAEAAAAISEWGRVLVPGGQLVLGTWEGSGAIDYGEQSEVVSLKYSQGQVLQWAERAGFRVDRCVVEEVEGMGMSAVYLDATADPSE